MVRSIVSTADFSVFVTAFREDEMGMRSIQEIRGMSFMDAADYAIQAQGYFRFAIAEIDCVKIEIEIANNEGCLQLLEVTK